MYGDDARPGPPEEAPAARVRAPPPAGWLRKVIPVAPRLCCPPAAPAARRRALAAAAPCRTQPWRMLPPPCAGHPPALRPISGRRRACFATAGGRRAPARRAAGPGGLACGVGLARRCRRPGQPGAQRAGPAGAAAHAGTRNSVGAARADAARVPGRRGAATTRAGGGAGPTAAAAAPALRRDQAQQPCSAPCVRPGGRRGAAVRRQRAAVAPGAGGGRRGRRGAAPAAVAGGAARRRGLQFLCSGR